MNITIVERAEKKFVGMMFAGPFDALSIEMPKLWTAFLSRCEEIPHRSQLETVYYNISDEDFTHKIYTEYIAVEVERFDQIPVQMVGFTIPSCTYLQVTHRGPMSHVQETYRNMFASMNEHGYKQDLSAFRLERYDQRFLPTLHDSAREENEYEILIPLQSI